VFVGDEIPRELRRVVEFLSGQMSTTEVLAIEVKQYVGGGRQTLVPRLIGETEAARRVKGTGEGRLWDKTAILEEIANKRGPAEAATAERIFRWAEKRGDLRMWFGSGTRWGSFQAGLDNNTGYLFPFALYTNGRIEVQFMWMLRRPPFDSLEARKALQAKLNAIPGIDIPDQGLERKPPISAICSAERSRHRRLPRRYRLGVRRGSSRICGDPARGMTGRPAARPKRAVGRSNERWSLGIAFVGWRRLLRRVPGRHSTRPGSSPRAGHLGHGGGSVPTGAA
jgi:hypothetical protein